MKRKAIFVFSFLLVAPCLVRAATSDLVISEIMYDWPGADDKHEWVEVYNNSSSTLSVVTGSGSSAWRFFDGSNHTLKLVNGTTTIQGGDFFVLASDGLQFLFDYPGFAGTVFDTVMSLPNSSSSLALSFDGGTNYSAKTSYDVTWGGNGNGFSLEKIVLNQDSQADNWQESSVVGGTPGLPNSLEENSSSTDDGTDDSGDDGETDGASGDENEEEPIVGSSGGASVPINYWLQIIISEFLPNPVGSDDQEWIELYNRGPQTVDLSGFALQDNSTRIFTLGEDLGLNLNLVAEQYLLLSKSLTKISLNNTGGDMVKLYNPNGELLEKIAYQDLAPEGKSYARENDSFFWTAQATPGTPNVFLANQPPVATIILKSDKLLVGEKIVLSAEESADPEEGNLRYLWDFGDEKTGDEKIENHIYEAPGSYIVKLKVTDEAGLSNEVSKIIEVGDIKKDLTLAEIKPINFVLEDLIISEFLPNPVGSDDNEWIELYNNSAKTIDLLGWQLDDAEGGSRPYVFATSTPLEPSSFLVVNRKDSKITLNNSSDSVRLLTPLGEAWQAVAYENIPEGQAQAWDVLNQEWFVAEQPTPGGANLVTQEQETIYTVGEASDLDEAKEVLVQGVALNSPDKNFPNLYLVDYNFSEVNFTKILEVTGTLNFFSKIKRGDLVTVHGKIGQVSTGPRLKIKKPEDIWLNDVRVDLPEPEIIKVEDLDQDLLGSFVKVVGMVVKKTGKNIYLAETEDSEAILRAYTKFPLVDLEIKKGLEIVTSGILAATETGFKLMPFTAQDISLAGAVLGAKEINLANQEQTSTSTFAVLGNQKNKVRLILLILFFVALLALGYLYKKKRGHTTID
jgi:PKD repeat protein